MRETARAEGRPLRYDGRWRDRDPSEAPAGVKPVIRLKAPTEGETVVEDQVQGRVVWQNKDLDDLVLLRSDGTPTYMLAVVVDDHDMGVTHVIRGDDHLTNAARQTQIYRGARLGRAEHGAYPADPRRPTAPSCRSATARSASRPIARMGYLPAALRNYLVRLGWSHGDQEIFSTEEMIDGLRSRRSIGRSPARFDFAKLENLNGHYMRADGRRGAGGGARDDPARASARSAASATASTPELRAQARRRHAGPEGARQDAGRAPRQRHLPLRPAPARARRQGARSLLADGARSASPALVADARGASPTGAPQASKRRCATSPRRRA